MADLAKEEVSEAEEPKKGGEGYDALAKLGVPASLGERMLLQAPRPQVEEELPAVMRAEEQLTYNPRKYDFRSHVASLLQWAGPKIGFGSYGSSEELELFQAKEEVFSSFKYEKRWRQCILDSSDFLACYELLLKEVICPHLKSNLIEEHLCEEYEETAFFCQFPPTLRLQPGPSERPRRLHRDAEFGHQDGEINFWMPLTDYSRTQTTLWVESGPNTGDFHPLALDVGRIAMFHGTLVRHYAPPNPTKCLRVSMDFRVGIGKYYDPDWKLEGLQHYHGRLKIVL